MQAEDLVYFIKCKGMVKIGHSINPEARLSAHQCSNPFPLELIATEPGGRHREAELHNMFNHLRAETSNQGAKTACWFQRAPLRASETSP